MELPLFRQSDDEDGGFSREDDEVGGRVSREDDYFNDFGITDYTANQFDVHEQTSHFMECHPITDKNRVAVEAVYMIEALTLVKSMKTMCKPEVAQHLQER